MSFHVSNCAAPKLQRQRQENRAGWWAEDSLLGAFLWILSVFLLEDGKSFFKHCFGRRRGVSPACISSKDPYENELETDSALEIFEFSSVLYTYHFFMEVHRGETSRVLMYNYVSVRTQLDYHLRSLQPICYRKQPCSLSSVAIPSDGMIGASLKGRQPPIAINCT